MDINWLQLKLNKKMADLKANTAQVQNNNAGQDSAKNLVQQTQNNIINNVQRQFTNPEQMRMNNLASIDRAVYIKDLLNLPKNMVDLLVLVQKNQILQQPNQTQPNQPNQSQLPNQPPQGQQGLPNQQEMLQQKQQFVLPNNLNNQTQNQIRQKALFNPHFQLHQNVKDRVRNNFNAQIQQPSIEETTAKNTTQNIYNEQQLTQLKKQIAQQLDSNVHLSGVSSLLQQNSKVAMNKMILAMAMATKQGMTDIKPLQETINIINASISATSQNDSAQTLKNLILLYLPWLPLQDGVGFDLDIEESEGGGEKSETFIKILISTRNYGNLHATVSLITGNSVDVEIVCSENFPEKELRKRLRKESDQHSMQSAIEIVPQKISSKEEVLKPKAKVNLSDVENVNPYLLLICHAIIRHVIELDSIVSIGEQPIKD